MDWWTRLVGEMEGPAAWRADLQKRTIRRMWGRFYGCLGLYRVAYRLYRCVYRLPQGTAPDPSKLMNLHLFDPFWVRGTLGYILTSILPSSHIGKRLGA